MITVQPYKGLSTLLYALAVLEAIAGLILIFGSHWALSMVPGNLALPDTAFVTVFMNAIGIIAIGLGYLLCVAARDPARYVAVIDTLVFILIASAILIAYALTAMHIGRYFPAGYIVVRIVIQLILAGALIAMRPKPAARA